MFSNILFHSAVLYSTRLTREAGTILSLFVCLEYLLDLFMFDFHMLFQRRFFSHIMITLVTLVQLDSFMFRLHMTV